jgi:hypothetical protein
MNILHIGSTPVRIAPLQAGILGALSLSATAAAYFALTCIFSPLPTGVVAKTEWRAPSAVEAARTVAVESPLDEQTLTRPIFSKTRRPQPGESRAELPKDAPPPAAPPPAGISVKAVVITGKAKTAFLTWDAFPEGKWIREGETILGWTISSVNELDLVLNNGEQSSRLIIDYSENGSMQPESPNSKAAAEPDAIRVARDRGR